MSVGVGPPAERADAGGEGAALLILAAACRRSSQMSAPPRSGFPREDDERTLDERQRVEDAFSSLVEALQRGGALELISFDDRGHSCDAGRLPLGGRTPRSSASRPSRMGEAGQFSVAVRWSLLGLI